MKFTIASWKVLAFCAFVLPFAVAAQVTEPKVPKVPGNIYTNGVQMILVKLPGGYWAGRFEVTQKQYQDLMGSNPSEFKADDRPVDNVSWNDAMEFCRRLTASEIRNLDLPVGFAYSLPSESQWESWSADAQLKDSVTSEQGPRSGTERVGSLSPNGQGLFDVRGNVMEFCLTDASKPYRVLRGGSWQDRIEINLRPSFRFYCQPDEKKNTFGFRCVLTGP